MEDKLNNARKKSIGNHVPINFRGKKMLLKLKSVKQVAIAAMLILSLAITTTSIVKKINERNDIANYIRDYKSIMMNNTHYNMQRVMNDKDNMSDDNNLIYDTHGIARELLTDSNEFPIKFYTVYSSIGYNETSRVEKLDEILSIMNTAISTNPDKFEGFSAHENFNDFLIDNGFIDENGKPSKEKYEKSMYTIILAQKAIENTEEERQIPKK